MSAASDKFENDVAKSVNKIPGVVAVRPRADTAYADVKITYKKQTTWMEVKMNHTDNLSNPRVFYKDGKWQTTYNTPVAHHAVDILNKSQMAKKFITDIAKFSGIPVKNIQIPTTKSGLKEPGAVPLHVMKKYFDKPNVNRYIANNPNMKNLGKIVTEHYTKGKAEPAYYMQADDDFYRISNKDPFNLGNSIPLLSGEGDFKVRISTRSEYYEVQAEIKIDKMPKSKYSLKPGTKKQNPFVK